MPNTEDTIAISPLGFVLSLILAPLLPAAALYWLSIIPYFALFFGGLPWLLVGGPMLWWAMRSWGVGYYLIAVAVFVNLVVSPFLGVIWAMVTGTPGDALGMIKFLAGFGIVFAAIWTLVFIWLYRGFQWLRSRRPRTPNS